MANKDNPKFYTISTEYIDYLRETDSKVPFNKDEQHSRPYVGVLEKINGHDYFVPLTSRNDKNFNSQVSVKLFDTDEKRIGVLLVNNMIPVPEKECKEIDIAEKTAADPQYGNLMLKQYLFLKENMDRVTNKVEKVYKDATIEGKHSHKQKFLKGVCCDFTKLEEKCQEYKGRDQAKERDKARRMAYMRQMGRER
ncbi:hypothetical protein IK3_05596 [Bacillus toyonensis]|uniref:type III toxin-antitoxin system ToxN/AbiQ family toxin n=1 Tax=Bacillus cereus group TaxID=86661 RepID=UPI000279D80B|nr:MULTISPECIES: type III toxin-antitoxin system ToxN/AbiQ family toxin [Bacillus cereus group]EJR55502.1 hypothetical protein IK3_05596 [Bacillus toyonensis]PEN45653.1 type III toxin-antitoxin system ToxN/AbiQ family toxin [Bacillus wiedmannii]